MGEQTGIDPRARHVTTALPSLGFFGGTWGDCLRIDSPMRASAIEVRLVGTNPEFLNLRGVLARGVDHQSFQKMSVRTQQSSIRLDSQSREQTPLRLTGIHTLKELNAYWRVEWLVPQEILGVQVFNRADHLGKRSREMRVTVTDFTGRDHVVYDSTSAGYLLRTLAGIRDFSGVGMNPLDLLSAESAAAWREKSVRNALESLRTSGQLPSKEQALSLSALLPSTKGKSASGVLSDDDMYLLAYLLCLQVRNDERSRSGISSFSQVLDTTQQLEALESKFDDVTSAMGAPAMYLAKHGITPRDLPKGFDAALQSNAEKLTRDCASVGVSVSLAYGTLLGAIREGGPIAHDDDFDFFATIEAPTHESFVSKRKEFLGSLSDLGWEVTPNGKYFNFHIRWPGSPVLLDVFAVHIQGDAAFTHMERAVWREIPARWFHQTELVPFGRGVLPAITEASSFLEERYGAGWLQPDKFHEWKWKLYA